MRQTSTLTRALTASQELHASARSIRVVPEYVASNAATFRLYFVGDNDIAELLRPEFTSFTEWYTRGVDNGLREFARVVEIVAPIAKRRDINTVAERIRLAHQQTVLVTESPLHTVHVIGA